jgi:hypothetical protein
MRTILLFIFLTSQVYAQSIKRQTFASFGSSTTVNSNVYISQSIGQSSIIGLAVKSNVVVQQGYQQSIFAVPADYVPYEKPVIVSTYPNPFVDEINLKVNTATNELVTVTITDMNGKIIHKKAYNNLNDGVSIKLDNLIPQSFTLNLSGSYTKYSTPLIKQY